MSDEYMDWLKSAPVHDIKIEIVDLEAQIICIKNQLSSDMYKNYKWRISAQNAIAMKRADVRVLNIELARRKALSRGVEGSEYKALSVQLRDARISNDALRSKIAGLKSDLSKVRKSIGNAQLQMILNDKGAGK